MKNYLSLLKIELLGLFGFNKAFKGKDMGARNRLLILIAAFVPLTILFAGVSTTYSLGLSFMINELGGNPIYTLGIMFAALVLMTLITTVSKVKGTLFGGKDYDMLMSIPVKTSTVVAAKFSLLYIIELYVLILILVPSMIVYGISVSAGALFYITFSLVMLFVPLVVMVVSVLIGMAFALIAGKFRHSNLVTMVLSMAFLVAIVVMPSLTTNDEQLYETLITVCTVNPLNFIVMSIGSGEYLVPLLSVLCSIAVFALFAAIVGKNYKKISVGLEAKVKAVKYVSTDVKHDSPTLALFKKEIKKFFSSSMYFMNAGIGVILCVVFSIVLAFQIGKIGELNEFPSNLLYSAIPIGIALLIMTSPTTAPSISLEGKTIWILQSSPVSVREIFKAKILVNIVIAGPCALLSFIILAIAAKMSVIAIVLGLIYVALSVVFVSVLGLFFNLLAPLMDWKTEMIAIKQSMSVLYTMLVCFGVVGLSAVAVFLLSGYGYLGLIISTALMLIVTIVAIALLKKHGKRLFNRL